MSAAPVQLLRLPEVRAMTGLSRSELYRRMQFDFPRPVKLGERSGAWVLPEVLAWCQSRIAARDGRGRA